jgi:DNA replication protein DnaC
MKFLAFDSPSGSDTFSQIRPCPVCSADMQQKYLTALCGLSGEMLTWDFSNTKRIAANALAYDAAKWLAQQPQYFYTLMGKPGRGKTRLLAAIVNEARKTGRTAVYTTTSELFDHLRATYAPTQAGTLTYDAMMDKITSCTVLALDEFDRYSPTDWAQEKFFQLIERRYRRGDECLTCFATNAALDDLPQYVTSRMLDRRSHVFEIVGADLRKV